MLGHNVLTGEESLRKFAKFADFAALEEESTQDELLQRNASRILGKSTLGYAVNFLYQPPQPTARQMQNVSLVKSFHLTGTKSR